MGTAEKRDCSGRCDAKIAWIQQSRVANDQVATRTVRECAGNTLAPCGIGFLVCSKQLRDRSLECFRNNWKAEGDTDGDLPLGSNQIGLRRKSEASNAVSGKLGITGTHFT